MADTPDVRIRVGHRVEGDILHMYLIFEDANPDGKRIPPYVIHTMTDNATRTKMEGCEIIDLKSSAEVDNFIQKEIKGKEGSVSPPF